MAIDVVRGAEVLCTDGFVGTVGHLVVDQESGGLLGFVLHLGPEAREDVFVPIDWIARADPRRVVLLVTRTELLREANPRREGTVP